MSKIIVIGAGLSGLSAATYLADAGHEVHVYEKNEAAGGRARQFTTTSGYVFDRGPSWYWMPEVLDGFFQDFGHNTANFFQLDRLDPAFEIVFGDRLSLVVPGDYTALRNLFESIEAGSARQLDRFMKEARLKYEMGMKRLVHMPGLSFLELAHFDLLKGALHTQVFSSFSRHVRKYFSHPWLVTLMEFPVLFLGAAPNNMPALYSLMNYAGLKLGTWYPQGGFGKVTEAMFTVAREKGAKFHFNCPVDRIEVEGGRAIGIVSESRKIACDAILASADYHHVDTRLLPDPEQNYDTDYWEKRTLAPSCLIYYIGLSKKIDLLRHHTLFFDEDMDRHSQEIYTTPQWPQRPLFYACCPSKTDTSVAPPGHENLFLLMPLAPGLEDPESLREEYFRIMMARLKKHTGEDLTPFIDFKKSYCVSDFIADYNSFKGNAYGLANILSQTALFKPSIRNRHLNNFVYAGQLTVPGPGVPPSVISGKMAARLLLQHLKVKRHEAIV